VRRQVVVRNNGPPDNNFLGSSLRYENTGSPTPDSVNKEATPDYDIRGQAIEGRLRKQG
jgi:hypothetical protein